MKRPLATALVCLCAAFTAARAQQAKAPPAPKDPHAGHRQSPPAGAQSAARKYFSDVELVTQDGKTVRLYSDVLKGRTVVLDAFFTTCTTACPAMAANMKKVQQLLGERSGRDVLLVSISVDPVTDTPERLREYAQRFEAGPGWLFLTGKKENVDWALYKLGQYVEKRDDHGVVWIIGNEATGLWKKAYGLARPSELHRTILSVADDKGAPAK